MSDKQTVYLLYAIDNDYYASADTFFGVYSSREKAEADWAEFMKLGGAGWQTRPDGSVYSFFSDGYVVVEETIDAPLDRVAPYYTRKGDSDE